MRKRINFLLIFVFLLAAFFRFYLLTDTPLCLNWDEASFAYNAYSIAETGKDEYAIPFPFQFKSVGDYKLPLFVYLLVPLIKIFGLNEFSVRFLPSFLGTLSVIVIYKLSKLLFQSERRAIFSSILLAISPWHLQFTRAGADVGVASFFTLLGIYLFIRAIKTSGSFFLSFLSFSASFYTYFGERIFIPIFMLAAILYFRKNIMEKIPHFLKSSFFVFLILLPAIITVFSSGQKEKFLKTTIFGYSRSGQYLSQMFIEDKYPFITEVLHNEYLEKTLGMVDHYLNHFSPSFLFTKGPVFDQRSFIYRMGMLYLYEIPFLFLGIFSLLKAKSAFSKFILFWLLLGPIPSAITNEPVHARRSLNMIYPLALISAVGTDQFLTQVKSLKRVFFKTIIYLLMLGLFSYSFLFYFFSYYIFTPARTFKGPSGWNCGYKELVAKTGEYKNAYDKIVVDTSYQGPYIFFLFYEKYPPEKYQPQARLVQKSSHELGEGAGYDNYEFRPIYWPDDRGLTKTLFAGPAERIPYKDIDPKQSRIVDKIYFANGEEAFLIVETF